MSADVDDAHEVWPLVVGENELDFKYGQVFKYLPIHYRYEKYTRLLLWLALFGAVRAGRPVRLHLRYLKWRGAFRTMPVYVLMIALARLQRVPVVWTCHNVWEHRFPQRWQNALLRRFVAAFATRIVVLHGSMVPFLPERARAKTVVAHFGSMRPSVEEAALEAAPNTSFARSYAAWLGAHGIEGPDLIMVSASLTRVDELIRWLATRQDVRALVIAPRASPGAVTDNVFLSRSPVHRELDEVLSAGGAVGYLGHENHSVPTAVYMFAAYGIPMVGKDVSPVRELLTQHGIGKLYGPSCALGAAYDAVRADYGVFQSACTGLIREQTWGRSAAIHAPVFA